MKILIAGDENCQCIHWRDCSWSKLAVFSVMNQTKEKKEFKEVQRILGKHTCGDDPKDHFVNCCGPDQKPNKIDASNDDGKGFSDLNISTVILFEIDAQFFTQIYMNCFSVHNLNKLVDFW